MIRSVWIFLLGSVAAPLYRPFYSRRNITAKPTNKLFSQMHFIIAGCCKHQLYCIPAIQEATRRSWTTHLCREFWWCDQACGWHTEGLLMLRNWFLYFFLKFKSAFPSEALVFSDLIKNWNRSDHLPPPPQYILPYPLSRDGEDWDWTHLQQLLKKILTVLTDVTTVRK